MKVLSHKEVENLLPHEVKSLMECDRLYARQLVTQGTTWGTQVIILEEGEKIDDSRYNYWKIRSMRDLEDYWQA